MRVLVSILPSYWRFAGLLTSLDPRNSEHHRATTMLIAHIYCALSLGLGNELLVSELETSIAYSP